MKVALLCRSDRLGGAAVVSRRLAEALREAGADATLVALEASVPATAKAGFPLRSKATALAERAQVWLHNSHSLENIWKADTGSIGLPLWRVPAVRDADAVVINWTNQGMLSLDGIGRLARMGKKIVWTMHDMWPFTGVCHHAMECRRFEGDCGRCPLLGARRDDDLSRRVWERKRCLYEETDITFVAVSSWLWREARRSSLLRDKRVELIPNPFRPARPDAEWGRRVFGPEEGRPRRVLFAAASLDNWIKGLDVFRGAVNRLAALGEEFEVVLMGAVRDARSLEGFALPVRHLGLVEGEERMAAVFGACDVVVNCSDFENLPGTLVEAQAYGAVPVAFDRGGQRDIVDHLRSGYLAPWSPSLSGRVSSIADGIRHALAESPSLREGLRSSALRFSYPSVAARYLAIVSG